LGPPTPQGTTVSTMAAARKEIVIGAVNKG
jgi:hypothetical protein